MKYSRQRDAIVNQLSDRTDHPTAETLYLELKETMPNISMGTIYRNLRQLATAGDIMSISSSGATRFDPNPRPHSHFFCTECGAVMDVDDDNAKIVEIGQEKFDGRITGCVANYYGLCPECEAKRHKTV